MNSDRRGFVKRFFGGAVGLAALPKLGDVRGPFADLDAPTSPRSPLPSLPPSPPPGQAADEAYWQRVKEQFPLREGLILMNAANLCPSSYAVQATLIRYLRDMDEDGSFQNRSKFSDLRDEARTKLANHLGADAEEIAIVRNTTEANNTVVGGLDLGSGDEVLLWDQNHPTNNVAWDVRAERYGFRVRRVTTPRRPANVEDLVTPFLEAMNASTRVLSFSHVSNTSGVALPAGDLCSAAGERDILTLVDGAQSFGVLDVDLHAIGCDFYTGSIDKWPMGPEDTGLLYVRRERVEDLWPEIVGVGWGSAVESGSARKFETLGQRDDAAIAAVSVAMDFHRSIGRAAIEARTRELAGALKRTLRERVPGVTFHTPDAPEVSGGVVVFDVPGMNAGEAYGRLYDEHDIGCARRGQPFPGLRFSPHVYNTLEEVERVADAVAAVV